MMQLFVVLLINKIGMNHVNCIIMLAMSQKQNNNIFLFSKCSHNNITHTSIVYGNIVLRETAKNTIYHAVEWRFIYSSKQQLIPHLEPNIYLACCLMTNTYASSRQETAQPALSSAGGGR